MFRKNHSAKSENLIKLAPKAPQKVDQALFYNPPPCFATLFNTGGESLEIYLINNAEHFAKDVFDELHAAGLSHLIT